MKFKFIEIQIYRRIMSKKQLFSDNQTALRKSLLFLSTLFFDFSVCVLKH